MLPLELADIVGRVFESLQVPYFVTGSVASSYYGIMRTTQDVDVVADLRQGQVRDFCAHFPVSDWYISEPAAFEASRNGGMFNILHHESGLKVDVIVPVRSAYEESRFSRVRSVETPCGGKVQFSSSEDVILKKLEFYREGGSQKHLRDIAAMVRTNTPPIDFDYLESWAKRLGVWSQWEEIRRNLGPR